MKTSLSEGPLETATNFCPLSALANRVKSVSIFFSFIAMNPSELLRLRTQTYAVPTCDRGTTRPAGLDDLENFLIKLRIPEMVEIHRGLYIGRDAHAIAVRMWMFSHLSDLKKFTGLSLMRTSLQASSSRHTVLLTSLITRDKAYDIRDNNEAPQAEHAADGDFGAHRQLQLARHVDRKDDDNEIEYRVGNVYDEEKHVDARTPLLFLSMPIGVNRPTSEHIGDLYGHEPYGRNPHQYQNCSSTSFLDKDEAVVKDENGHLNGVQSHECHCAGDERGL
jgi:hypothetical protein